MDHTALDSPEIYKIQCDFMHSFKHIIKYYPWKCRYVTSKYYQATVTKVTLTALYLSSKYQLNPFCTLRRLQIRLWIKQRGARLLTRATFCSDLVKFYDFCPDIIWRMCPLLLRYFMTSATSRILRTVCLWIVKDKPVFMLSVPMTLTRLYPYQTEIDNPPVICLLTGHLSPILCMMLRSCQRWTCYRFNRKLTTSF